MLRYSTNFLEVYYYQFMKVLIMGKDDKCFNRIVNIIDDDRMVVHDSANHYT